MKRAHQWTLESDVLKIIFVLAWFSLALVTKAEEFRVNHLVYGAEGRLKLLDARSAANTDILPSVHFPGLNSGVEFVSEWPTGQPQADPQPPAPRPGPGFHITRWDVSNGLPAGKIRTLLQTRDGYLWIGTVGGLARFDGAVFTIFDETTHPAMAANGTVAMAMLEDDEGLWIGTKRGLLCYQGQAFRQIDGVEILRGIKVNALAKRAQGGIWIGTDRGLFVCENYQITLVTSWSPKPQERVLSLLEDASIQTLWIGGSEGLRALNLENDSIRSWGHQHFIGNSEPVGPGVYQLHLDDANTLWIQTNRGLFQYRPSDNTFSPVRISKSWMRLERGEPGSPLSWVMQNADQVLKVARDGSVISSIPIRCDGVMCLTRDRHGTLWIGTHDGLLQLRPEPFATAKIPESREVRNLQWVCEGIEGSLWYGTPLWIAHWSGRQVTIYDSGPEHEFYAFGGLVVTTAGRPWVALIKGGVAPLPTDLGAVDASFDASPRHPEIGRVLTMCAARESGLWLSTKTGLYRLEESGEISQLTPYVPERTIRVLEDSRGCLWLGTETEGLYRLDTRETTPEWLRIPDIDGRILAIHEDREGSIWVGGSHGLTFLGEQSWNVVAASNLSFEGIQSLGEDSGTGTLWIHGFDWIARVALADLKACHHPTLQPISYRLYGVNDGLLNPGASAPQSSRTADGRLWFVTAGGLAQIDPAAEQEDHTDLAPIRIESVRTETALVTLAQFQSNPPDESRHRVEFAFTAPNLYESKNVQMQYRLDGIDDDWREAGMLRQAAYESLPAGRYVFRVRARARNHSLDWQGAVAPFTLSPRLWERWPFQLGVGLLGFAIAWLLVKWTRGFHAESLEAEGIRAANVERQRLARDAHDHLGAYLSQINLEDHTEARRAMMAELDEIIWLQRPENDSLEGFVDFIMTFGQQYFDSSMQGPSISFDIPMELPDCDLPRDVRQELAAIYKETLRNIRQHACAREVEITLRLQPEDRLFLSVRDNGCGFDPQAISKERNGNGLTNLKTRAAALGGHVDIESSASEGAIVTLTVPLQHGDGLKN